MKLFYISLACLFLASLPARASSPVVLELFTSQGCSSCPPADAVLQKLSADPRVLALSFHIDYWDADGWKDPFSLPENTGRQQLYQLALKQPNLYTPELIIDGQYAMIGSRRGEAEDVIDNFSTNPKPLNIVLTPNAQHTMLTINVTGQKPDDAKVAGIWLVSFNPVATSAIRGGENRGREMTSINNVTSLKRLGEITDANPKPITVKLAASPTDGYAVLVQETSGKMLGAGSYLP